jgi:hypothetical protein
LFVARGMLFNLLTALEVPDELWPKPLEQGTAETAAAG